MLYQLKCFVRQSSLATAVAVCGALVVTATSPTSIQALAAQTASAHSGFYVMSETQGGKRNNDVPAAIYDLDGVTGVHIRFRWDRLEPARGNFDWDDFDREVGRAVKSGKKIAIGVLAGSFAPRWMKQAGVKSSSFVIGKGGGESRGCITVNVPWPWDETYQAAYVDMMEAIAARLKEKGAYKLVTLVKLTGVAQQSQELRMPAGDGTVKMRGKRVDPCQPSNATEIWLKAGYRPSKVVKAWIEMAKGVDRAFPDKVLAQSILDGKGFPQIGENGKTGGALTIKDDVIATGLKMFPGRFAVQWNGLKPDGKISQSVLDAKAQGAIIGWQTNHYGGKRGGAGCNAERQKNVQKCVDSNYQRMLERGIDAGGSYIEVWIPDALKFDDTLSEVLPKF